MSDRLQRRVVITGVGMLTPLGNRPAEFFDALVAGRTGIRPDPDLQSGRLGQPVPAVGRVRIDLQFRMPGIVLMSMDRTSQLAVIAARDAVDQAGWLPARHLGERAGVFMGASAPGMESMERAYAEHFTSVQEPHAQLAILAAMPHAAASHVAQRHGVHGECQTYASACTSSTVALGEAFRRIRCGDLDRALAGGADCTLTNGVLKNWADMRMLCVDPPRESGTGCRPFSADRNGFAIGEGAAVLALESMESALARGASWLAEIAGYGVSHGPGPMLRPAVDSQARAMRMALSDAGIEPAVVGHINANGSATLAGDTSETNAIKAVFGRAAYRIPVSATKSAHGHLMGATGAVELIAAAMALQRQVVPPTTHWRLRDPDCDLDYVPREGRGVSGLEFVLSNSFGFGGGNACIVLRRAPAPG